MIELAQGDLLHAPTDALVNTVNGLGGLDWNEVRPCIESAFATMPDVRVLLYAPVEFTHAARC
ncbi:MAG: hypothetical protein Q7S40_06555 [Opitutaceae bacterium]|nr:hypothetical protein [Opitutaceae bacterium]